MPEPPIVQAIRRYHPEWEPPADNGREWTKCLCPFHDDEDPSAGVSFEHDAFSCFSCEARGSVVSLIKQQEKVSHAEATRIADELSAGGNTPVPQQPIRQPGRRVFGEPRTGRQRDTPVVSDRVRGRPTPWS